MSPSPIPSNKQWSIVFFAALALFTLFCFTRIQQPISAIDLRLLAAARAFHHSGIAEEYFRDPGAGQSAGVVPYSLNPYLYLHLLALMFRLFGESQISGRLVGLISGIVSIILVFVITKSFTQGTSSARLRLAASTSMFYAFTATTIQGTVLFIIDATILVPLVLLLCFALRKYYQEQRYIWAVLFCLAAAVSLWGRLPTPLVILFLLTLYIIFSKLGLDKKLTLIGAVLTGIALFMATWYLYCLKTSAPFWGPLHSIWEEGLIRLQRLDEPSGQVLQNAFEFGLWLGIFPSLLLLMVIWRRCRALFREPKIYPQDIFFFCGLLLILGYTLFAGTGWGYPAYCAPAIALIFIGAAGFLSQGRLNLANLRLREIIIVAGLALAVQVFIGADLLYAYRYTLRSYLAFMSPLYQQAWQAATVKMILFCLANLALFTVCLRWRGAFRKNIIGLLIIFSLGANIGRAILQSRADYQTGYNYGAKTAAVADYIRQQVPKESIVLAPEEIIYYLDLPQSVYLGKKIWIDLNELNRRLQDRDVSALAYSVTTNTVAQLRKITEHKQIQKLLRSYFAQFRFGGYIVWIRREYAL